MRTRIAGRLSLAWAAFRESFRLEWRAVFRSKAFLLLLLGVTAWMTLLPRVLQDDGTAAGAYALRVRYALGVAFVIVLVSLAATAAGAIARDRSAKRLQLTQIRPVPASAVALGRMGALVSVGGLLLALAAAILHFQVGFRSGRTCDHVLAPDLGSIDALVEQRYNDYLNDPARPEALKAKIRANERAAKRYLAENDIKETFQAVAPGETVRLSFDTSSVKASDTVAVRVRLTSLFDMLDTAKGRFELDGRTASFEHINKTILRVPLVAGESARTTPAEKPGTLLFTNTGTSPVVFYPWRDVELLVRADGFGWNLVRAWLELVAVLSVVVALAVFLSAGLSRSVSVFVVLSVLIVMVLGPAAVEDYPDPLEMSKMDRLGLALCEISESFTAPMNAYSPIGALEGESCVERAEVARAVGINLVFFPLVLALLSGIVIGRKQDNL